MLRTTAIALIAGLAASPAALAQAPTSMSALPSPGGNVVGGGIATISGGGDNLVISYGLGGAGGGATFEQPGRHAVFAGNHGDGPVWRYTPAVATGAGGREAWLIGGGDDAQLVYASPAGSLRR